jgi:hypothetical protein
MGDFSAQTDALDEVADKCLSQIAQELAVLSSKIGGTAQYDGPMFGTEDEETCPLGRVRPYYVQTRDLFKRVLADDAENLQLAAQALKEIAKRYREADGQG